MSIKLNSNFDFNFDPITHNLEMLAGLDNLEQNVKIILNTFYGENKFFPTFGTRLQDILGQNASSNTIKYVIKTAILKDNRYSDVKNILINRNPDYTATISAEVVLASTGEVLTITGEING
jgi:hypothetical protein